MMCQKQFQALKLKCTLNTLCVKTCFHQKALFNSNSSLAVSLKTCFLNNLQMFTTYKILYHLLDVEMVFQKELYYLKKNTCFASLISCNIHNMNDVCNDYMELPLKLLQLYFCFNCRLVIPQEIPIRKVKGCARITHLQMRKWWLLILRSNRKARTEASESEPIKL